VDRLKAVGRIVVADYDHVAFANAAFEEEGNPSLELRDDLDSFPDEIASSFPDLYKTTRASEVPNPKKRRKNKKDTPAPKPPRKTKSFSSWRRARHRANKFAREGHQPSVNTIRDVVDVAAVAHLAGFDAKSCQIVSTGYTGKTEKDALEEIDEVTLTPDVLRKLGLKEIAWDGRYVLNSIPVSCLFPSLLLCLCIVALS
jgi:hypothetical protein